MSETAVNQDANQVTETPVFTIREENRFKLDPNFVVQFIGQQPKWGFGLLSYVTYKRTYARRLDKAQLAREAMEYLGLSAEAAGRHAASATQESEEYWQTCVRVVEGVSSIYKQFIRDSGQNWSDAVEQEHAQAMFQRMWDLKFTPPGRGLWGMGTSAMELKGSAMLNNCFAGHTMLPTLEYGVVPMQQVEGKDVCVLTSNGWKPAKVKAFGTQPLQRVWLAPADTAFFGFSARPYDVTPDHRWITTNRGEVTDLRVGDAVPASSVRVQPDTAEYQRGFTHGVLFVQPSLHVRVPAMGGVWETQVPSGGTRTALKSDNVVLCAAGAQIVKTSDSPVAPPAANSSADYISGFFAGLFAEGAGPVEGGRAVRLRSLHGERPDARMWFLDHLQYAEKPTFLAFQASPSLHGAGNYLYQPDVATAHTVQRIQDLKTEAVVYCPQVPEEHAFTLAGGVYTGNCGFCSTQHLATDFTSPFERLMDFSMLGVGMGFDVLGAGTVTLQEPEIDYTPFTIPDTREGWVHAVKLTLGAFVGYNALPREWDYSQIRPEGAPLRTFGGTASGHGPLKRLLDTLYAICRSYVGRFIDDAFIVDVMNVIGVCVVAGNVRRSSEIALGSPKSESFLRLKDSTKVRELSTKIAEVAKTIPGFKELADDYFALYQQTEAMSAVDPRRVAAQQDLMGISARMKALTATSPEHVALEAELYAQPLYTHRWASNNTVLCEIGNTDYDAMAEQTLLNGEPGYGWLEVIRQYGRLKDPPNNKDRKAMGVNPCVPAGTRILTRQGYRAIETLVGQRVDVWNGEAWASVEPKVTGHNQPLVKVSLSDGTALVCTDYHKWHLAPKRRNSHETDVVRAIDLQPGDTLAKFEMPVVETGEDWELAYTHGFFCGDGQVSSSGTRSVLLYGVKKELAGRLLGARPGGDDAYDRLYVGLPASLPDKFVVRHDLSVVSRLAWLAGVLDADGCVLQNPNSVCLQLSSSQPEFLQEVRLMLTTLGVQGKITLAREAGMRSMPDGKGGAADYHCQASYRLLINAADTHRLVTLGMRTHRLDLPLKQPQRDARRFVTVEDVAKVGVADVVYCFEELTTHRGTFEGIVTGQCGEQSLHDGELCCVSGDTRIQTRTGSPKIADVVGQKVQVWNGDRWSEVTPFVAASGKKLFRVYLSDGSYLDCTDDHGWHVRPDGKRVFRRVDTKDLPLGAQSQPYALGDVEGTHSPVAYEWGLFLGDGFMDRGPMLVLHGVKVDLLATGIQGTARKAQHPEGYAKPFVRVSMAGVLDEVRAETLRDSSQGLPDWIFALDTASIRELVAGWIDTDGHVNHQTNTDNYRVFGSEAKMRSLQLLLRRIGVNHASVYQMAAEGEATNYGERNYALWVCYIPSFECAGIPTRLKIAERFGSRYGVNNAYPNGKPIDRARKQTVVRVEELPGTHTTYCFSEPENHMGVFGNALTYQCLVESYPTRHETLEDFLETLKYAYRYAKAVTLIPTHDKKTNAVMVRNRRIGTSMAGIIEMYSKLGMRECKRWWDEGYKTICEWDTEYSSWLGVNESIKKTSLKPGGTTPLLVGVEGGMKAPTSAYYMRTIRIDHISPLLKPLRDAGYRMEPDLTTPRTMVVYFPVKAPQGVRSGKEISLWEQAEIFTALQAEWSDNMVSATLTFQDHERGDVARVLKNYEGRWKGVSFLPFSDHGFAQAPYIPCSKTEYENAVATLSPVTLDGNMISHDTDDKYCSGGLCETPVPSPS